jgi:hypothetical protein
MQAATLSDSVRYTQVDAAAVLLEKRVPSASPVLGAAGVWELVYTTEKDVHLFCRCAVLCAACAALSQRRRRAAGLNSPTAATSEPS